jgi:hypothetical protein
MLREADRDDQLAEWRLQQKNVTAQITPASSSPGVFASNAPATATTTTNAPATSDAMAMNSGAQPTTTGTQQAAKTQAPAEELPAFVPAPKSLVSSTAATEVAAMNTNLNGDARATLTSLTSLAKPIDTAVNPISTRVGSAQLSLAPGDQSMRVGESRRFALDIKSEVPLALAIVALRFDPRVVKVRAISLRDGGSGGASFTQSTDAAGVCLLSISSLSGMTGPGTLLFIDVEGIGLGDAALFLDKDATHLVATDARDLAVEVTQVRATVKQ